MTTKDITYRHHIDRILDCRYYALGSLNRSYLTGFGTRHTIYDLNYKFLIK